MVIFFYESFRIDFTIQTFFKARIARSPLIFQDAGSAKRHWCGTDSAQQTAALILLYDRLAQGSKVAQVLSARHPARHNKRRGLRQINLSKDGICHNLEAVT